MIPHPSVNDFKKSGYGEEETEFLERVAADYSDLRFRLGRKFAFRPPRTIVIGPPEPGVRLLVLHEIAHALLEHRNFKTDVERLKMEVAAWEKVKELAIKYCVQYDEGLAQDELDTYRDFLHQKSRCPECGLTRFQTPDGQYHCPRCENFTTKGIVA